MRKLMPLVLSFACVALLLLPTAAQPPGGKGARDANQDKTKDYSNSSIVTKMMAFNKKKDGKLTKDEVTDPRLHRLFDLADTNKDGVVTKEELMTLAAALDAEGGQGGPGGRSRGSISVRVSALPRGAEVKYREGFGLTKAPGDVDALRLADVLTNDLPQNGFRIATRFNPRPGGAEIELALFPQETWRDPDSGYLRSAFHDVPWQSPEFIAAYSTAVAPEPPDWIQILRSYLRQPRRLWRNGTKAGLSIIGRLFELSVRPTPPAPPKSK